MDTMENREKLMQRDVMLVAAAGVSLLNGQGFSPYFDPVLILFKPFIAGTFFSSPLALFYLTSIFVSAMTLVIAGIPAALYERLAGHKESTPRSVAIWLIATILISIPTIIAMAGGAR